MSERWHWMDEADYCYNICNPSRVSRYILGQDEDGDLFVPQDWAHPDRLYRRFNRWIPLHWLAYFNSWRRREIATLESFDGDARGLGVGL